MREPASITAGIIIALFVLERNLLTVGKFQKIAKSVSAYVIFRIPRSCIAKLKPPGHGTKLYPRKNCWRIGWNFRTFLQVKLNFSGITIIRVNFMFL
jgi:hypothetical protein